MISTFFIIPSMFICACLLFITELHALSFGCLKKNVYLTYFMNYKICLLCRKEFCSCCFIANTFVNIYTLLL